MGRAWFGPGAREDKISAHRAMTDYSPALIGAIDEAARGLGVSSPNGRGVTRGTEVTYCGAGAASTRLAAHQSYRASDRRFISSCVIKRCSVFSADPGKLMNLKPSV